MIKTPIWFIVFLIAIIVGLIGYSGWLSNKVVKLSNANIISNVDTSELARNGYISGSWDIPTNLTPGITYHYWAEPIENILPEDKFINELVKGMLDNATSANMTLEYDGQKTHGTLILNWEY